MKHYINLLLFQSFSIAILNNYIANCSTHIQQIAEFTDEFLRDFNNEINESKGSYPETTSQFKSEKILRNWEV